MFGTRKIAIHPVIETMIGVDYGLSSDKTIAAIYSVHTDGIRENGVLISREVPVEELRAMYPFVTIDVATGPDMLTGVPYQGIQRSAFYPAHPKQLRDIVGKGPMVLFSGRRNRFRMRAALTKAPSKP